MSIDNTAAGKLLVAYKAAHKDFNNGKTHANEAVKLAPAVDTALSAQRVAETKLKLLDLEKARLALEAEFSDPTTLADLTGQEAALNAAKADAELQVQKAEYDVNSQLNLVRDATASLSTVRPQLSSTFEALYNFRSAVAKAAGVLNLILSGVDPKDKIAALEKEKAAAEAAKAQIDDDAGGGTLGAANAEVKRINVEIAAIDKALAVAAVAAVEDAAIVALTGEVKRLAHEKAELEEEKDETDLDVVRLAQQLRNTKAAKADAVKAKATIVAAKEAEIDAQLAELNVKLTAANDYVASLAQQAAQHQAEADSAQQAIDDIRTMGDHGTAFNTLEAALEAYHEGGGDIKANTIASIKLLAPVGHLALPAVPAPAPAVDLATAKQAAENARQAHETAALAAEAARQEADKAATAHANAVTFAKKAATAHANAITFAKKAADNLLESKASLAKKANVPDSQRIVDESKNDKSSFYKKLQTAQEKLARAEEKLSAKPADSKLIRHKDTVSAELEKLKQELSDAKTVVDLVEKIKAEELDAQQANAEVDRLKTEFDSFEGLAQDAEAKVRPLQAEALRLDAEALRLDAEALTAENAFKVAEAAAEAIAAATSTAPAAAASALVDPVAEAKKALDEFVEALKAKDVEINNLVNPDFFNNADDEALTKVETLIGADAQMIYEFHAN